jgi:hypothetical protein
VDYLKVSIALAAITGVAIGPGAYSYIMFAAPFAAIAGDEPGQPIRAVAADVMLVRFLKVGGIGAGVGGHYIHGALLGD